MIEISAGVALSQRCATIDECSRISGSRGSGLLSNSGQRGKGGGDTGGGEGVTLEALCVYIVDCEFGFDQDGCEAEFLSFCTTGDTDVYLQCMGTCTAAYDINGDCAAFGTCEEGCWASAGCM